MTTTTRTPHKTAPRVSTGLQRLVGSITYLAYRAWALSLLWAWHVAGPLEWPAIGLPQFVGLSLIYVLFTRTPEKSREGNPPLDVLFLVGWVTVGLGVGYIAHLFM